MTHDRGAAAVIGVTAVAVLAVDLIYTASRWDGTTGAFGRGFASGFIALVVCGLIGKALGVGKPSGDDRARVRRRSRRNNIVGIIVLALVLWSGILLGNQFAAVLGNIAALASFFTAFCVSAVVRSH